MTITGPTLSPRLLHAVLLATALAAPHAHAQQCSWAADLPGAEHRMLTLAGDGGHGVLSVSWPTSWVDHGTSSATLRLHHVLEHGAPDPALPTAGVTFFAPAPGDDHRGVLVMQVLPDASAGVWVLAMHNNPFAAKLRPYETATFRLHHVAGSGAVATGWPAGGLLLDASFGLPGYADYVGIVPDGSGGVIAAWISPTAIFSRTSVRAQRFAADGSALWPGGPDGLALCDTLRLRQTLRIAGDGVGGLGIAVATTFTAGDLDLRAFRVLADGTRAWGLGGRSVYPGFGTQEWPENLAFDGAGDLLIQFHAGEAVPEASRVRLQFLDPSGSPMLDAFGSWLAPATGASPSLQAIPGGFLSVHAATGGGSAMQRFDEGVNGLWGTDANGIPSPPYGRPPVRCAGGSPVFVWAAPGSAFGGPPTEVHALEIGADGAPAPGWPGVGVSVCGALYGHVLSDATSPDGESVVVGLGTDDYGAVAPRILRLGRAALAAPPAGRAGGLLLRAVSPNPSSGDWDVRLTLPGPAAVRLSLFDVAGRVVFTRDLGTLAEGASVQHVSGAGLAPGVYRLRVTTGGGAAERVLIRVR